MKRALRVREVLADFIWKMRLWRKRPPEIQDQLARCVLELTKLNNLVKGYETERRKRKSDE